MIAEWLSIAALAAAFLAAGAFAGLASGALGAGGGLALAPALYHLLGAAGFDGPLLAHQAMGAAAAALAVLSAHAALAHARAGGVDWAPLRRAGAFAALGGGLGALGAAQLSGLAPLAVWGVAAFAAALLMGFGDSGSRWGAGWPGGAAGPALGLGVGLLAGGAATGGGAFAAPLLRRYGAEPRAAAALAAGFGAAAAAPAAAVWALAAPAGPAAPFALGAVNPPGVALCALAAAATAPQGARLAREAPGWALRLAFAFLIAVTALSFVATAARG